MANAASKVWRELCEQLAPPGAQRTQIIATGLGFALVGGGWRLVRLLFNSLLVRLRRQLLVTVELQSRDESFQWVLDWLSENPAFKKSRALSAESFYSARGQDQGSKPRLKFVPALGDHYFRHDGRLIWVTRERHDRQIDMTNGGFIETMCLTMLGRDRRPLCALVEDAMSLSMRKEKDRTAIFTHSNGRWKKFASRAKRPLHSVILAGDVSRRIVQDALSFVNSADWYRDKGIPYRRGYLLHGNPGTGKSSFILALAGELDMNICVVSLSNAELTDDLVGRLLNSAPGNSIVLLEDIDAAFVSRSIAQPGRGDAADNVGMPPRDGAATSSASGVTLSGLLNALDGVIAQEGSFVFMTTNHIERLDPALIRPGRIDMQFHFGLATRAQMHALFCAFFSDSAAPRAAAAAASITAFPPVQSPPLGTPLAAVSSCSSVPATTSTAASSSSIGSMGSAGVTDAVTAAAVAASTLEVFAEQFSAKLPEGRLSMAQLQGYLMLYRTDMAAALENLEAELLPLCEPATCSAAVSSHIATFRALATSNVSDD